MIISVSGILLIDKEAMIDFAAILSLLVNLPTFLSCHFVKIKITFIRSVHGKKILDYGNRQYQGTIAKHDI